MRQILRHLHTREAYSILRRQPLMPTHNLRKAGSILLELYRDMALNALRLVGGRVSNESLGR